MLNQFYVQYQNWVNKCLLFCLQINMPLKNSMNVTDSLKLKILANTLDIPAFPLLWADENAELDEENADLLKSKVVKPIKLVDGFSYFGLALGCILVTVFWVMVFLCKPRDGNYYA